MIGEQKVKKKLLFFGSIYVPKPTFSFSLSDIILLLIFIFFGVCTRTFNLSKPSQTTFDEIWFGNFTNYYLTRKLYFDIHPYFAKLLLSFVGKISGYNGSINFYQSYEGYQNLHYFTLRLTVSSFSSFVPSLGFLTLRFFGYSKFASSVTAVFLCLESMLIIEGRFILTDGILHFFTMLSIFSVSLLSQNPTIPHIIFTAVSTCLSFSIKYTSLSLIPFILLQQLLDITQCNLKSIFQPDNDERTIKNVLFNKRIKEFLFRLFLMLIIVFPLFFLIFILHIIITKYPNPEIQQTYPIEIQRSSLFNSNLSIISRIFEYLKVSHLMNMKRKQNETNITSKWYQWPFIQMKSIIYCLTPNSVVLLHANPITMFSALFAIVTLVIICIGELLNNNQSILKVIIWPFGYFASLLPFMFVKHSVYAYHYLIPYLFAVLSLGVVIDLVLEKFKTAKSCFSTLLISICIISYCYLAPLCYGLEGFGLDRI